ncbi:hypothetical protein L3X38_006543 [Prunus dulcis]|uniref:DYW domain-containing protein n=1 Tax=Prunus dulcis TaxID=3755 RepID=A0AAD4ZT16_PRUDU|nr:hypothetical protein L3X38_006543 [Prunus dulcis]
MTRQPLNLLDHLHQTILQFLNPFTASLSQARQAHAQILKTGLSSDTNLTTKLLSLYANNLCFDDANFVLDSISEPNLFSYSTLIHAFAKLNQFGHALGLFSQMLSRGLVPDSFLFPSVVKACAGLPASKAGKQVHAIASVSGLASDSFVQSSLVHMYIKCDQIRDARKLFDRVPQRDVIICSALISGYSRRGYVDEAMQLLSEMRGMCLEPNVVLWNGMIAGFNQSKLYADTVAVLQKMHSEGFQPDGSSISSALPAVGHLEDLGMGIQIHGYVVKQGLGSDKCVVSALIDMYGKCACSFETSQVFHEMDQMDVGACNALVTGLSRNGLVDNALKVFRQFKDQGMELNIVSWTSIIASCSQNGKDMEALELFREMQVEGVEPNSVTIPCLLPACGNIAALMHGKAAHCFSLRRGISNDVYVGSSLIDMYAKCGKIRLSRLCFDEMPTRNLVCWNAVMADMQCMERLMKLWSQKGLTDEGWYYFNSMSREHGLEARVEHYACMVTLLSRSGKLEEAYSMIKQMPFEPDACVWGALLSSCRVHSNVTLGKYVAKKLFNLEPKNPGNYILLSNIYASKGMWSEVDKVRDKMKSLGLRKNPGCSWIEVKNKVHMLLAGDKAHPQMNQIIEKLNELSSEMKKLGYFPNTHFVLQDVEEQDKEQILCGHSEKLAVVFEGREISVRDTNLFHHFKDGVCSCEDYW